ncbi:MAG: response regulator [Rhodospirillales bacterium]
MARVLLIDDDEMVLYALSKALTRAGHEVETAANGGGAKVQTALKWADVLVTDIIMPEKEGLSVLMEAQQLRSDLPVIVISGGSRAYGVDYLDAANALGAAAVFTKPVDDRELSAKIAELCAG